MVKKEKSMLRCPRCGMDIRGYSNPAPTVDIIIEEGKGIVLIMRRHEPCLWALPGGYCDYGESLEEAAMREAIEETGLEVDLIEQFYTYSDPRRDPRQHNITTVFIARSRRGSLNAQDDAQEIGIFSKNELPSELAFDHAQILKDYFRYKETGRHRLI